MAEKSTIKPHGRGKSRPSNQNSFNDQRPLTMPSARRPFIGGRRAYTGEQLREIRRINGVGRPPHVNLQRGPRDA